jgi:2-dehydro-3-deoxygalactonokinase
LGTAAFIAGDWGTTHLRLSLCAADGTVLETTSGPGIGQIDGEFPILFAQLIAPWATRQPDLPTVLCGMVGSTLGWLNVPYVSCPAQPATIAQSMAAIAGHRVLIAPGLTCRNRHDAPDVMRGEETQILGAIDLEPSLSQGRHLLCLPGTHTKWVVLDDGVVREFLTAATGELFALIKQHSVLVRAREGDVDAAATFDRALDHVRQYPQSALAHLLFECRSRQLGNELSAADAPHFLSGLLIGQDVAAALALFADVIRETARVVIVGTPHLMQLHSRALSAFGASCATIDGAHAALAGLTRLYQYRFGKERMDVA